MFVYSVKTNIKQCWFYIFSVQLITLSTHISFSNGFMILKEHILGEILYFRTSHCQKRALNLIWEL